MVLFSVYVIPKIPPDVNAIKLIFRSSIQAVVNDNYLRNLGVWNYQVRFPVL